jgi:hypothetical protein
MKKEISIVILFVLFFLTVTEAAKADVILGSGVNITNGTIIYLTGLNSNITVIGNYVVNNFTVSPNYLLIYTSLTPTSLSLPYAYDPSTGIINITSTPNTTPTLTISTSSTTTTTPSATSGGYFTCHTQGVACIADRDCCSGLTCINNTCLGIPNATTTTTQTIATQTQSSTTTTQQTVTQSTKTSNTWMYAVIGAIILACVIVVAYRLKFYRKNH